MGHWLRILPDRYRRVERFNHGYPLRAAPPQGRTLEIGAGRGGHVRHEDLSVQDYHAVELRPDLVEELRARFPTVHAIQADCQRSLPYGEAYFDRVLAIHILEHLPDLPAALEEVRRVLKPTGRFVVCIPCEGGLAHRLGRRLTVQRTFERRYGVPYGPHIRADHINEPREIMEELRARFRVAHRRFYPLGVPLVDVNIQIGLTLEPRPAA
jgi:SAM-dependent methyltransferase